MKRLALLLVLSLVACKEGGGGGAAPPAGKSDAPAPAQTQAGQENQQLGEKLSPLIDCLNRHTARIRDSRERYLSWAGEAGPSARTRRALGLYSIYDTGDCVKGVAQSVATAPKMAELDQAAQAYAGALQTLAPLVAEAERYYDQEDWKDDAFARGIALHPKLLAAFAAFTSASSALDGQVKVLNRQRREAQLVQVEREDGKRIGYHVMRMMLLAEDLADVVLDTEATPDLARLEAALAAYEEQEVAFQSYCKQHAAEADKWMMLSSVQSNADYFLKAGKDVAREVRAAAGKVKQRRMDELAQEVHEKYNDLVDATNSIRQM